jgi:hypothetical protein
MGDIDVQTLNFVELQFLELEVVAETKSAETAPCSCIRALSPESAHS